MNTDTLLIESLKKLVEAKYAEFSDVESSHGSTHDVSTGKLGDVQYHIKFPSKYADWENINDPSLQILTEYLAYNIYKLYGTIKIPATVHLVFKDDEIGIASQSLKGHGWSGRESASQMKQILQDMASGLMVDMFLSNWDIPTSGNLFITDDGAYRIDPGGSLGFRAQGGRKGKRWLDDPSDPKWGEINTMRDSNVTGNPDYSNADLKAAAEQFNAVDWSEIESTIPVAGCVNV